MFVMTVERRNLQLLKEFILNGRFSQNIYTYFCKLVKLYRSEYLGFGGKEKRALEFLTGLCRHPV